jgi:hypothetical protein
MQTILGIFDNRDSATQALATLEKMGYGAQDIAIDVKNTEQVVGAKGGSTKNSISGATAGIVIGGLSGLLLGLAAVSIPGIGISSITEPLASTFELSGIVGTAIATAVLGALAGAAIGALLNLSRTNSAASVYEEHVVGQAIVLAVPAVMDGYADQVRQVFQQYHAEQIRSLA